MAPMNFEDLPPDIRDVPLTDPVVQADLVDLLLGIDERRGGVVGLMICDQSDRGVQPVVIGDVPPEADFSRLVPFLELVLPMVADNAGSVLVGRGRRRGLAPTDADREWHQGLIDACRRHGARLLGFYLATPDGVEALPEPLSEAS